ncbi:MerR family transcriptional regulator [Cryobacterium suzukii]|uniref:MerR family transcriptional regulator n=2 Tax=Cryobacterium suzukii TaxID=1259198 RepID=A0A4R9ADM4_9MICO|nr:MerR family transcriptional regulator [Cryobacterium suzukii]
MNVSRLLQHYPNVRVDCDSRERGLPVTASATGSAVTMHIGELAEKTGLSLRTIRHYDEVGLLKASARTEGGFRLYTQEDHSRLMLIRRMKPLGFSLDEMMALLKVIDTMQGGVAGANTAGVRAELDAFVAQAMERRQKLQDQLQMADEFLELLRTQ